MSGLQHATVQHPKTDVASGELAQGRQGGCAKSVLQRCGNFALLLGFSSSSFSEPSNHDLSLRPLICLANSTMAEQYIPTLYYDSLKLKQLLHDLFPGNFAMKV